MRLRLATLLLVIVHVPLCIALSAGLGGSTVHAQSLPIDGLLGYWPFDGDSGDASGGGHDGVLVGAPVLVPDRFGDPDHAVELDGSDDWIDLGTAAALKPALPVTVLAWVRPDPTEGGTRIVFRNDWWENHYSGVWVGFSADRLIASFGDGGEPAASTRRSKVGDTVITPGEWIHIAAVIRDADDMDLYLDGIDDGGSYSGTGGPIAFGPDQPAAMGIHDSSTALPNTFYDGAIDEVLFYDRALDAAEVEEIFTCACGLAPLFARGDCDNSATFDTEDPVFLLSYLFESGAPSTCDDSCDANDDGVIDIADSVMMLTALHAVGPPPLPAPYLDCGADPTVDDLDCGIFTGCP